jgi:hypothetical protein
MKNALFENEIIKKNQNVEELKMGFVKKFTIEFLWKRNF